MEILVTGLCSCRKYNMEFHNLGNYIITEPLFEQLRVFFPNAVIKSTIQMTDNFNKKYNLIQLIQKRFWSLGRLTLIKSCFDLFLLFLWRLTKLSFFLNLTPLLKEFYKADLIIFFSGDIYGDNANTIRFLENSIRVYIASKLQKKVASILGSPGPFKNIWKQRIAKNIFNKLSLFTVREPISQIALNYICVKNSIVAACPSVLFKKSDESELIKFPDTQRIINTNNTIGLILCGWNMPIGPYNKWPRDNDEYNNIISLIKYILDNYDYDICLFAHQNLTNEKGELQKGNDHRLINQLLELIGNKYGKRLFTFNSCFNASQSKCIIGKFNMLISGRIHGAVQALSQAIPTAIIDYGHEPKAHKLKGFARIYGVDDYLIDLNSPEESYRIIDRLISHQNELKKQLEERLPYIKRSAIKNFELLRELCNDK